MDYTLRVVMLVVKARYLLLMIPSATIALHDEQPTTDSVEVLTTCSCNQTAVVSGVSGIVIFIMLLIIGYLWRRLILLNLRLAEEELVGIVNEEVPEIAVQTAETEGTLDDITDKQKRNRFRRRMAVKQTILRRGSDHNNFEGREKDRRNQRTESSSVSEEQFDFKVELSASRTNPAYHASVIDLVRKEAIGLDHTETIVHEARLAHAEIGKESSEPSDGALEPHVLETTGKDIAPLSSIDGVNYA